MEDYVFEKCREINDSIIKGDEHKARNLLICLLGYMDEHKVPYNPLVNA